MLGEVLLLFGGLLSVKIRAIFWLYCAMWALTLFAIVVSFRRARPRLRQRAIPVDTRFRAHAHRVRFGSHEHEDVALRRERVALTWFFRFWTNFASAPSLSIWSLAVPAYVFWRQLEQGPHLMGINAVAGVWLLPGLCYFGSMLLSFVLKRVFKRLRPPLQKGDFGYKLAKDPSFPSGHSLTSFCFWTMVPVSARLTYSSGATVSALIVLAIAVIGLTGMSRIYLRVHYPSDVLGGYLIGAIWASVCLLFLPGPLAH